MDPILLQKQVRDNANELNSFLSDLKNWEKDMKRKDQELLASSSENVAVPPVRSRIKRPKNSGLSDKSLEKKEVKRISSYDYSSWDKFDVVKACAQVDAKEKEQESSDSGSDTETTDTDVARLREQALYEKELGNKYVKEQKWPDAIACYTKAIQCNPYDAIFYANRALCYLKTKCPKLAETDCTTALQLDSTYVKAYQRRALARIELGLRDDAKIDFQKVLELEPNNSAANMELSKLEKYGPTTFNHKREKAIKKIVGKSNTIGQTISKENPQNIIVKETTMCQRRLEVTPDILGAGGDTGTQDAPRCSIKEGDKDILPLQKPPHLRSKRPLKVIPIQEVESMSDLFEKCNKSKKLNDNMQRKIVEIKTEASSSKERTTKQMGHSNKEKSVIKADVCLKGESSKLQESIKVPEHQTSKHTTVDLPPVPKTSVQFLVSWKIVKNDSKLRYQFLKQIPGNEFPQIFQESLESKEFGEIINSLASEFLEKNIPVYPYLQGLSEVRRFSALVMFMSKAEKAAIKKLLQRCDENSECSKEDITKLLKCYESH